MEIRLHRQRSRAPRVPMCSIVRFGQHINGVGRRGAYDFAEMRLWQTDSELVIHLVERGTEIYGKKDLFYI